MRILTGIQPSGQLHIGNYFGAMRPAIGMQEQGEVFLFIASYHALTSQPEAADLRSRIRDIAIDWLACGVDPAKTTFYRQTDVPAVTELAWILFNHTPVGMLERATSYKDKVAQGIAANTGLFTYPILQAADILICRADRVPVGQDQKQHIEITRDVAIRFNNRYGEILTIPEGLIREDVAVVPGLDGRKMSKSYDNTIPLFAPEKALRKIVMKIVTDSTPMEEPKNPDTCNAFALYKLFASESELAEMRANYEGGNYGYGHAKQALFEAYWEHFRPMRERRETLLADPAEVDRILDDGGRRARATADPIMADIRQAVGLV
jgi:tryptophanyl-tRNA synthetase